MSDITQIRSLTCFNLSERLWTFKLPSPLREHGLGLFRDNSSWVMQSMWRGQEEPYSKMFRPGPGRTCTSTRTIRHPAPPSSRAEALPRSQRRDPRV